MAAQGKILVVDDDERSARTLANMLREDGYDVDVAVDGAHAIARLSHSPAPTVLITDIRMPHADGATVSHYARLRKPGMPIIMVTGYPHLAPRSLQPQPIVLTKPIDYDDLSAALVRASVGAS
jgi:DNA-binding NtrC family response regulator